MESNAEKIKLLRSNAHNYACLISSVKELTHLRGLVTFTLFKFLLLAFRLLLLLLLLLFYSLDTGEALSPREKVIQSARRVGLSVPNFSDQYKP